MTGFLLQHVAEAGGDARALAAAHGLGDEDIGALHTMISIEQRAVLFDAAAELLGDPFLGLHLLPRFERGHFGLLEYAAGSARDVRDAHRRLAHYAPLVNPRMAFSWAEHPDGRAELRHHIVGNPSGAGRHAQELTIAGLVAGLGRAAVAGWRIERAWFAHAAPPELGELRALLGTDNLEFSASDNGYLLPAGVADLPLRSADPRLLAILSEQADAALAASARPIDLVGEVRAAIRASLPQRGHILEEVSVRLQVSPRTLQRRLQGAGVRFHDVLVDERREQAVRMVSTTRSSLRDIARELGYSDFANFLRAFKRWTGSTPGQLRKRRAYSQ